MEQTVSFYTLGCRLNQAETAVMQRGFEAEGYRIVHFREPADLAVINTCTVTENGDSDTRRLVNKLNRLNPHCKIALVGCQAQVQREKLLQLPGVQWVIGNAVKMELANWLNSAGSDGPQVYTPVIPRQSFTVPFAGIDANRTRANIKIQDGCDFFCSFCEIPFARGRARSRQFGDIIKEAHQLVQAGRRELVLTGINIGTYDHSGRSILEVLGALNGIAGVDRIRISSIEPTTIPSEMLDMIKKEAKLCRHLHIPLQSGSDHILDGMKRKYNASEFLDFVNLAIDRIPDLCLGTDIIVGFPGESRGDFDDTYETLLKGPFAYFHVFSYSARDHAPSRRLPDAIERNVIDERSGRLRELSHFKRRNFYERFRGSSELVLFEQEKAGFWTGLTDHYIRVKTRSEENLANRFLPVKLEKIDGSAMIGSLE